MPDAPPNRLRPESALDGSGRHAIRYHQARDGRNCRIVIGMKAGRSAGFALYGERIPPGRGEPATDRPASRLNQRPLAAAGRRLRTTVQAAPPMRRRAARPGRNRLAGPVGCRSGTRGQDLPVSHTGLPIQLQLSRYHSRRSRRDIAAARPWSSCQCFARRRVFDNRSAPPRPRWRRLPDRPGVSRPGDRAQRRAACFVSFRALLHLPPLPVQIRLTPRSVPRPGAAGGQTGTTTNASSVPGSTTTSST